MSASDLHPLMRFKVKHDLTWADIADRCRDAGTEIPENVLVQIGMGHSRPSFGRCEFIATKVLGKPHLAVVIYNFPYTRTAKGAA